MITPTLRQTSMFTIAPDGRIYYAETSAGRIGVFSAVDRLE